MPGRTYNSKEYRYGFNGKEKDDDGEFGSITNYDYGFRIYNPAIGNWLSVDPLAADFAAWSPYNYVLGNPIRLIDPDGRAPDDWVEGKNGKIYWDENATSQSTTNEGEKYLGKNVLVGTHNRDVSGKEKINSAVFDVYLETNKTGPSATIKGNTVPSDTKKSGTLAEGLYSARFQSRAGYTAKGKEDLAILINEGLSVPTTSNSPKKSMTEVFFHMGNNYQTSLSDSKGNAYSRGCQLSGCYKGSRAEHNTFMNVVGSKFNGSYYLRSKPVEEYKPALQIMIAPIPRDNTNVVMPMSISEL